MSEFLSSHSWQVWMAHHMGLLSFRETPQAEEMGQQGPYEVQQREIQVLHLGRNKPMLQYRQCGLTVLTLVLQKRPWRFTKFTVIQNHSFVAMTVNSLQGCIRQSIARRSRDVILPLFSALLGYFWSCRSNSGLLSAREI